MILVDLNQVLLAGLMAQIANQKGKLDEQLIRHMILNIIRLVNYADWLAAHFFLLLLLMIKMTIGAPPAAGSY